MSGGLKPLVLIVDDERNTREGLARALRKDYRLLLADSGAAALDQLSRHSVDVMLSDVRMPGMDGLTLLRRALARSPQPVVIMLTAYGTVETAVEAIKAGAYNFLEKPVNLDRLDHMLRQALASRNLAEENRRLREQLEARFGLENMVGESAPMQDVFGLVRQVAPSRTTVLLEGESGTGKELVARALHQLSPRAKAPLVAVHCAALSPQLLESELFGHEKGAFTGAHEQRAGRFERADGGTLFLDEIGEIDPATQVKILRVLEERAFERVGGRDTLSVDVRLIAATNRDLKAMVDAGEFREDLYYRLHVVSIRLPPLRERREDIPLLLHHYLAIFGKENHRPELGFTSDAVATLCAYRWPGNVRELRNVVESLVVLTRGDKITVRDLPEPVREDTRGAPSLPPAPAGGSMAEAERRTIVRALETQKGNRKRAAEELGISRRTLYRKLEKYGLMDF